MFDKDVIGLEIFASGTHVDSQGFENTFSDADVDYMVETFRNGMPEFVPIKLGHTSDEFNAKVASQLGLPPAVLKGENEGLDGVAALGQVVGLERVGEKLVADLKVPQAMAELFEAGYFRDVSCELSADQEDRWILDGVAMLGAERPAVDSLAGIAEAAILKKRPAFAGRTFNRPMPKKVKMSEQDPKGMMDNIKSLFKSELGESLTFSELSDLGLTFGDEADKGAVKDAVRELQDRSQMLDDVVALLQQAIEITSTAAEEGEKIIEDDVAKEPAVAAKALVGRIERMGSKNSDFKQSADFRSEVKKQVDEATKEFRAQLDELRGDKTVAAYRVETEKLVGMEGTPQELAEQLANLEESAGKESATAMLSAWQQVSEYAVKSGATRSIGQNGLDDDDYEPTKLDEEAAAYKKANPGLSDREVKSHVRLRAMRPEKGGE